MANVPVTEAEKRSPPYKYFLRFADGAIVCGGNEHTPVIMCHFVRS